MHRRGGKRICMDDPPPEYENPMTPMTPMTEHGGQSLHEPDNNYNYSHFNVGGAANSTEYGEEAGREQDHDDSRDGSISPPPTPLPTKRITRSRGKAHQPQPPSVTSRSPETPVAPRRGRGRGRKAAPAPEPSPSPPRIYTGVTGDDDTSLYSVLRNSKTAINTVVDEWIEHYKSNREAALVQLMQFFINASGCKGRITQDMSHMEHTQIIKKMTQEFDEVIVEAWLQESGEYPLIMAGQAWKKFRANFCDFIQMLVKMCQYTIIYDQYLMDNIISLLTGLSDSQVRAFRHTATLAVMKLMTALVDVALLTSVNCDNCLRQYEAERLKGRDKRANDRLEGLVAKRQELEENMEEIKNMLSYMFKSVFVHRYRDTLPEIRAITMAEIGIWMEKFPANFLDDLYLKYIGWTLHDKVGEVRLKCLQALSPLYSCEDLKGKLELFTSKFKDRIVSMSLDKEYEVAVQAVRLVIAILKMHPDVLTDKDCENVYELVYSSHRGVAQAAGEFLNVRLFRLEEESAPQRSRRGKKRLPNTPLIRDLVQFFIESELHEHGAYLVDSLIESNPMMKDWECMTDLLLEEAGPGEEALDNRQESSLIELMVCCVRQAATGEPPVGRAMPRKHQHHPTKEINKMVADDRQKLTVHFIQTLPGLLDKFVADPEKLANLVAIPQFFDLEVYTTSRQEGNLNALLTKMREIVGSHTENEVLEICSKTLEALCTEGTAIYTRCNVLRSTIADMCVNKYKEAIDEWRNLMDGGEEPDPDETFNVTNSLKKVSIMYMCHNLNNTNIWDSLFEDLPKCTKESEMPTAALVYCLKCCFYSILWSQIELEERLGVSADVSKEIAGLQERLQTYLQQCKDIVADGIHASFKEEAYISICDLLMFFAEHLHSVHHRDVPDMAKLVCQPDSDMCDLLNTFIQQYVFVQHNYDGQDERRIEELHKRRNFLAAYCKLIVYNVLPIRRAADVFKHYIKCYNDYGDIIKSTLGKAREINKMNCALTMALAMHALFTEMMPDGGKVTRTMQEFIDLKELAKRFALSFGLDMVKNREAVTALHRAGIAFAVLDWPTEETTSSTGSPPPHIMFFEILAEFTNKLIKQDKRMVLRFLDARIASGMAGYAEEWQPLLLYRNSLVHGETGDQHPLPSSRRAYTRKRHQDEEEAEENADSDQDNPGISGKIKRRSKRLMKPKLNVVYKKVDLPQRRNSGGLPSPRPSPSPSITDVTSHSSSSNIARAQLPELDSGSRTIEQSSASPSPGSTWSPAPSHTEVEFEADVHRTMDSTSASASSP